MPRWLRLVLLLAGLAWVGVVHAPHLGRDGGSAGAFLGGDLAVLSRAAGGDQLSREQAEPLPLQSMDAATYSAAGGERGSVLSGASLALSRRLWGVESSSATLYRLENLLLLLAAGLGLANFVRRLLLPWTGSDHARAAARALPIVLLLHPLAIQAVVDVAGRTELLYLSLASWCAASYLRARQDRKPVPVLAALVLAALAGLAGRSGLGLPLAIAVAEFASVQRYQARRLRLRRAGIAFLLVLAVGGLDAILRWTSGAGGLGALFGSGLGSGSPLERLGVLVVPIPLGPGMADAWSGLLVALAVALALMSMHPALRAARWAPRLWGWLLGAWFTALFLAALTGQPVGSGDFSRAETLLPAAAILVSGMVVVATGVQGFRRLLLPVVLAFGFGGLSLAQVGHHGRAAAYTADLRMDLQQAMAVVSATRRSLAEAGLGSLQGPHLWVLEDEAQAVERSALALEPLEGGIGHLLDGSLTGVTSLRLGEARRRPVLTSVEGFLQRSREPDFDDLRRAGVVLLVADGEGGRRAQALVRPGPRAEPSAWRGDPKSPDLDLDPFHTGALVVSLPDEPLSGASTPLSEVNFLARQGGPDRAAAGVWLADRGRGAGLFDLSAELDWLLAERVARMWLAGGVPRVESCALRPDLPGQPAAAALLELDRDGDDLVCVLPTVGTGEEGLAGGVPAAATWRLSLLGLESLVQRRLVQGEGGGGRLRFEGGAELLDAWPGEPVAWSLELLVDGRTIWRHRGRVGP